MTFYKDKTYYLQLSIIDLNGDFVTSFSSGESIDYVIRKSSDGSEVAFGEMTIDGNVWKVEWTPTIIGEYSVEYITPDNYENGTETITVEQYNNFKADVSNLALDSTVAKELQATENKEAIIAEIDANETKIDTIKAEADLIKIEVDKIQPNIIDDKDSYKADISNLSLETTAQDIKERTDNLPDDPASESGVLAKDSTVAKETTLNTKASQTSVDEIKSDTTSIISSLSTLVYDIWNYVSRTLTSFELVASDVWSYVTRTLTAGTKDAEIDAIKAETDKIKYILGLSQENYKMLNPVYNASNDLISATIKLYPSKEDCIADTNPIATYTMTASFDETGKCSSYRVVKN